MTTPGDLLWSPSASRVEHAAITRFRVEVGADRMLDLPDTNALHRWSVENPESFWDEAWTRLGLIGERGEGPVLQGGSAMGDVSFFPGAVLNVAENLLVRSDDGPAVIAWEEHGRRRELSWAELRDQASAFAHTLRSRGVGVGDRVAAWMPNVPETVVAFLGSAMVGAVFSSASPDFGVAGVLDRFGQIEPSVLVAADGYRYGGKQIHRLNALADVVAGLPGTPGRRPASSTSSSRRW